MSTIVCSRIPLTLGVDTQSGGPNHSTDTIMYYIYYTAFKLYRYGYGNAMGVVLAVIIAILSAVQFKFGSQDN